MMLLDNWRLKSSNPQTRREAVDSLAASGDDRAVETLVASLGDPDALVRRAAARAFNAISDDRAVEALISRLNDPSAEVRSTVASALGRQGDLSVIEPLVCALRDPKSRVRACAAASLRKLGWKPDNNEDHALFEIALGNPKNAVRAGEAAVEPLAAELAQETSFNRRAVAEALKDVNDPRAAKSLIGAAQFDSDLTVRVAAIYALAEIDDEQVIPALEKSLSTGDVRVRLAAAQVLAQRTGRSHIPCFIGLLKEKHFELRLAAVKFLASLRDLRVTGSLLPMLIDPDKDVREAAARAMGEMRYAAATESLVLALIDEELAVRLAAERALEQIDPLWIVSEAARNAKARLELFTHDNRSWVRSAAVMLVSKLGVRDGAVPVHA